MASFYIQVIHGRSAEAELGLAPGKKLVRISLSAQGGAPREDEQVVIRFGNVPDKQEKLTVDTETIYYVLIDGMKPADLRQLRDVVDEAIREVEAIESGPTD